MKNSFALALVCCLLLTANVASAQINLSFSFVSPTCQGYTNGSATVTATGGTEPYSYLWENGQTGQTNQGVAAGLHSVTVTDANNQTASGSVMVVAPAPFSASISASNVSCDGSSGLLTANGSGGPQAFGYNWSTDETTQSIQITSAGNYFVTVINANGCAAVANYTVANPLSVDVVVTNIPCATDPLGGAVNAVITGGATPYSVIWNDNNTNESRQNLPAGTYSVTVTDGNGCTATDQGTITMPTPLDATIVAITPSCNGANNGSATVVPSGGTPPYTHLWTPGGYTTATVTGLAPGQYYVCTFDANHCQKDVWVVIPEITGLQVTLSVLSAECTGVDDGVVSAIVNPPGNYSYQWNLPPFIGVTQLSGLAANTVVHVTVTDPVSGCSGTATTTVGAHNALTVDVVDTDIACAGINTGTATATAHGGTPDYQYVWLTPPTGPQIGTGATITGLAVGAYMVSVTDSRGCTTIGAANIGIESAPVAVIGGSALIQCGDSLSIMQFENLSTDAYDTITSWVWTIITPTDTLVFNNISPLQVPLPAGDSVSVQLTATSSTGCVSVAIDTIRVPGIPNITLNTGPVVSDCDNAPVDIIVSGGQPYYAYTWSPLTGLTLDSIPPNVTANPSVTTTYQLIADDQGCKDTVSVTIVRVIPIDLSVADTTIQTCDSTVLLLATANVNNIVWVDAAGVVLGANPVTVAAGVTAFYTAIATDTITGCVDSLTVSVTGLPAVTLSSEPTMVDCENSPVSIIINGGSPDYTYVWTPTTDLTPATPAPNVIADPEVTTTYQLIATNPQGCADTISVTVVRVIPIDLAVADTTIEACDSTVVLLATSNAQNVIWVDANGDTLGVNPVTVVAEFTTAFYTAIATDSTGCIDSLTVSVIRLPQVDLSTEPVLVDCDNAPLPIIVNGAIPGYTYTWSPLTGLTLDPNNIPNAIANPSVTTTYQLVATSGLGCNDTVTVQVIRVEPIDLAVADTTIETCDSTVLLLATANADNIIWVDSNGDTLGVNPVTIVADFSIAYYTAIATDSAGCVDSLTVSVIRLPQITLSSQSSLVDCANGALPIIVNGAVPGYTYTWSPLTGLTLDPNNPPNATANPSVTTTYQLVASGSGQGCNDTITVTVIRVDPIDLTISDNSIESCDSTVLLSASSNVSNVIWVNAAGDSLGTNPISVISGTTAIYTAIATDAYGCKDSLEVSVTGVGVDVLVDPNMPNVACEGTIIQLGLINNNPGDQLMYLWEANSPVILTGTTSATPTVSAPVGSYEVTVTVTNQHKCVEVLRIPVQIDSMKTLDQYITADLCDGKVVKFFNNSGLTGNWNFGDGNTSALNNPTHAYATAGMFDVSFTPSQSVCIMPWDSTINVQDAPLTVPGIANDYVVCVDSASIAFAGTSNNPNVTWHWTFSTGDTSNLQNPTITFTEEGKITATLVVTDPNGCTKTAVLSDLDVIFIDDEIAEELSFCTDTTIQLNADGVDETATYVWTSNPVDANLVSTDKNPTVSPEVETVYSVVISQGPLCSVTYQVKVTPKQDADVNLPPDMVICAEGPLVIAATGNGDTYQWSTTPNFAPGTIISNDSILSLQQIADQVYYIRTSNISGCTDLDSIRINNGIVSIQPEPYDENICVGEETQLQVTNLGTTALNYQWSPNLPNVPDPIVSPDANTAYQVIVSNANFPQCKDTLNFNVNVSAVSVTAEVTGKDTICPGMSTTILATPAGDSAPFTFEWSPADGLSDANIPNPTAAPEQTQTYTVTVTNGNGCTNTDAVTIYFNDGQCIEPYIFVPAAFTPNGDKNNDFFIVRGVNITELVFIVWDRWGEKVYETNDPAAQGWDGSYRGKDLTPDAYAWYLRATCGNGAVYENKGNVTLLK